MDCKMESTARSLVRIECLVIQGILHGFSGALLQTIAIPIMPFVFSISAYRRHGRSMGWRQRAAGLPVWFVSGAAFAVAAPFGILRRVFNDLREIARMEWKTRWQATGPKMPDGSPMPIPTGLDTAALDYAVLKSVVEDYGREADEAGQTDAYPHLED